MDTLYAGHFFHGVFLSVLLAELGLLILPLAGVCAADTCGFSNTADCNASSTRPELATTEPIDCRRHLLQYSVGIRAGKHDTLQLVARYAVTHSQFPGMFRHHDMLAMPKVRATGDLMRPSVFQQTGNEPRATGLWMDLIPFVRNHVAITFVSTHIEPSIRD